MDTHCCAFSGGCWQILIQSCCGLFLQNWLECLLEFLITVGDHDIKWRLCKNEYGISALIMHAHNECLLDLCNSFSLWDSMCLSNFLKLHKTKGVYTHNDTCILKSRITTAFILCYSCLYWTNIHSRQALTIFLSLIIMILHHPSMVWVNPNPKVTLCGSKIWARNSVFEPETASACHWL